MLSNTLNLLSATVLHKPTSSDGFKRATDEMRQQLTTSSIFGVFVTLKRSKSQTRTCFPHEESMDLENLCVQACLGYWDAAYQPITDSPFLVNKLIQLVHSFEHSDSRYNGFARYPLRDDSDATLELTLMQQPLQPIDHEGTIGLTHTPFSNNTHGCIIVAPFGTATFLPNIFPDTPFTTIRDHLISKASNGISSAQTDLSIAEIQATKYYAYCTTVLNQSVNTTSTKTAKRKRKSLGTRKQAQPSIRSSKNSVRVPTLLIPHAGKVYAGRAREQAFKRIPNPSSIQRIDYIAAVHNPLQSPFKDHSYEWVKDELTTHFPNATHRVYYPTTWKQAQDLAKQLYTSRRTCQLVIGTTDLMHYGLDYDYMPVDAQNTDLEAWKTQQEKPLLRALQTVSPTRLKRLYMNNQHAMCGPFATYAVLQFLVYNRYNKKGRCVSYYDSAKINESKDTFVSYAAFVYV